MAENNLTSKNAYLLGRVTSWFLKLSNSEKQQLANIKQIENNIEKLCIDMQKKYIFYKHNLNFTYHGQLDSGVWNLKNGAIPLLDNFYILNCSTVNVEKGITHLQKTYTKAVKPNGITEALQINVNYQGELSIISTDGVSVVNENTKANVEFKVLSNLNGINITTFYITTPNIYSIICENTTKSLIYEINYCYT